MDLLSAKHSLLILAVACLALVAACSDSGEDDAAPAVDSSATTITTTSTVETTTSSTTTIPPASTTDTSLIDSAFADAERPELEIPTEWDSDLDEIYGRYLLYWEALYGAIGPPFAEPEYPPLLDLIDAGITSQIRDQVQEYRDAEAIGFRADDSLDDHGLRLPNPTSLAKTEGNRVVIQDCWIRDEVVQSLTGEIITTYFSTLLWNVDMIVVDGEWKLYAATEAGPDSDGYQECQDIFDTLQR